MEEQSLAKEQFFKQLYDGTRFGTVAALERIRQLPQLLLREVVEFEKTTDNEDGSTALIVGCRKGEASCVKYLVEILDANFEHAGTVKFDGETVERATPLWVAAASGHLDIVRFLVERGAIINSTTRRNSTPLRAACFDGHFPVVKYLVERGADAELPNVFGHTCLMIVCFKGHYDIADYLLRRVHVNVNRVCESGNSALHDAAESECAATRVRLIRLLLEHGARIVPNQDGITPALAAALKQKNEDIVEYFVTAKRDGTTSTGGNQSAYNYNNQDDLLSAAEKADALELLGCTLISESDGTEPLDEAPDRDVLTALRRGATLWLRAERIRQAHNITATDYEAYCPQLVSTLRHIVQHLPPVRLLGTSTGTGLSSAHDETESDAMLIDRYAHPTNMQVVYAHALIRRGRIVGSLHADSIYFVKMRAGMYADAAEYRPALRLLRYALSCTLQRETRERERERVARSRGFVYASATNRDEPDAPVTETIVNEFLAFIELFDDVLFRERAHVDFEHLVDVFELAVGELERVARDAAQIVSSDANLSALVVITLLLSVTCVRALQRVGATRDELSRLERTARRACRVPVRAAQQRSLLHVATMNRFALVALAAERRRLPVFAGPERDELDVRHVIQELTFANELPDSSTIELLLRAGANPNIRDADGNTPLHCVALQLVSYAANGHRHRPRIPPSAPNWHIAPIFGDHEALFLELMDDGGDEDDREVEELLSDDDANTFQRDLDKAIRASALDTVIQRALILSSSDRQNVNNQAQAQPANANPNANQFELVLNAVFGNAQPIIDILAAANHALAEIAVANGNLHDVEAPIDAQEDDLARLRALTWRSVYQRSAVAMRTLVSFGHADTANPRGDTFFDVLRHARRSLRIKPHVLVPPARSLFSLQCLCARRLRLAGIDYASHLSRHLVQFVDSH